MIKATECNKYMLIIYPQFLQDSGLSFQMIHNFYKS